MKLARLVALFLVALTLVAATCVSHVEQRGERGPWVGEVVNTNDFAVFGVTARASIFDATGRPYYEHETGALTCPSRLLPGEHGAFKLVVGEDGLIEQPALPLEARFNPVAFDFPGSGDARSEGLLVTILDNQDTGVRVLVTNNSDVTYSNIGVCAVLRTDANNAVTVAEDRMEPADRQIVPGASVELNLTFGVAPEGPIRFFPTGLTSGPPPSCCPPVFFSNWHSVALPGFSVLLPPDWRYEPERGIDSFVGRFVGPDASLLFDYGAFSDPLDHENDPLYRVHLETIGGRTAKIAAALGGRGVTGIHIGSIRQGNFSSSALTVSGKNLTAQQQEVALQIFRSIRICECVVR